MKNMAIRLFRAEDTAGVIDLIHRNLFEVNIKDYEHTVMQELANNYNSDKINSIASNANFYVACLNNKIIGSGAIMPESYTETLLSTIFTLPEMQGCGIGRKMMATLEKDRYFLQAKKVILYSSISARDFYLKLGYTYKDDCKQLNDNGVYLLTKNVP